MATRACKMFAALGLMAPTTKDSASQSQSTATNNFPQQPVEPIIAGTIIECDDDGHEGSPLLPQNDLAEQPQPVEPVAGTIIKEGDDDELGGSLLAQNDIIQEAFAAAEQETHDYNQLIQESDIVIAEYINLEDAGLENDKSCMELTCLPQELTFISNVSGIVEEEFRCPTAFEAEFLADDSAIEAHDAREDNGNEEGILNEINPSETIDDDLTKSGTIRKRKRYKYSKAERKLINETKKRKSFYMKTGCNNSCRLKCHENISHDRRVAIHKHYWSLGNVDQQIFTQSLLNIVHKKKNSSDTELSRRLNTVFYSFKNENNTLVKVCKQFFLGTLGFNVTHDHIIHKSSVTEKPEIQASLEQQPVSSRQTGMPHNKIDRKLIMDHVESFSPTISHYRREHAPHRRYISSDITRTKMWEDFKMKNPTIQCSYDLYRSVVKEMNISFTKLGHEECECCENHGIHKQTPCPEDQCAICLSWKKHIDSANKSRKFYEQYGQLDKLPVGTIVYSVDLQKVIMLPRCDMFKSVIFVQRLVAYNESFVPVGKRNPLPPFAFVWHEATRGRMKEDIISTFHKFILANRDMTKIVMWLDNCTAQNKNWAFLSFLVYAVNEIEAISVQEIEINYFEPGHTFMSCDSFHHLVEKSLREKKKVYDFQDFIECVQNSRKNAVVKEMTVNDFTVWRDFSSKPKINSATPKPYIRDIVQISARRGKYTLKYKTDFDSDFIELDFLQKKLLQKGFPIPEKVTKPRGIDRGRRDAILARLCEEKNAIIPPSRVEFWKNLPCGGNEPENDIAI